GRGGFGRSLDIEDRTAARHEREALASLDATDFKLVGADAENGDLAGLAKLGNVIGVAIENDPGDARVEGGASHLRESRAAGGFHDDSGGAIFGRNLNGLEDLGALVDCVVIGKDDLHIEVKLVSSALGILRLLELIVVIVGNERNQDLHFWHKTTPRSCS